MKNSQRVHFNRRCSEFFKAWSKRRNNSKRYWNTNGKDNRTKEENDELEIKYQVSQLLHHN